MQLKNNPLFHILHIGKIIERELDKNINHKCRMTHSDVKLLLMVSTGDGPTQQYLADTMQVSAPAISRHIDKLEKDGYVLRKTNKNNRRSSSIELTAKGRKMHDKTKLFLQESLSELLLSCGEVTKATMDNLEDITSNLEESIGSVSITNIRKGISQN